MSHDFCEVTTVSRIKVSEKGQQAVILNLENETYHKIKIDGGLVKNVKAADWAIKKISENSCETLIIELKGTDVEHAISQISESIKHIKAYDNKCKKFGALIVCNRFPKFDSKVRKGQDELYRTLRTPLHITSRNTEHSFSTLM